MKENYQVFNLEDFEPGRKWEIYRGDSFLNQSSYISKTPEGKAWEKEKEVLGNYFSQNRKTSFMVHSYTEIPGRDKIEIRPPEPIYLPAKGIPIRLFFWAYSDNLDMTAKLILGQEKSKDVFIDLGSLKFQGWRRIEVKIAIPPKNIRLIQSLQIPMKLKGIRFQSSPFQKKGAYFFYLDQMSVLLDTSGAFYPGSEIKDNWGD